MNAPTNLDDLDDRFAILLAAADEALAEGSDWDPATQPGVSPELVARVRQARPVLEILEHVWPRTPPADRTVEDLPRPELPPAEVDLADVVPRVGPYEVLCELGRGGMGVVYKAWQPDLSRAVAIKMVLAGARAGPEQRDRFRREAELAAGLRHPQIVQVYETGEQAGCPYFSLEYMDGGSLAKRLAGRPLPPREAAELVEGLARAMQYAHESGVIHRDLKPSNILLQRRCGARASADATADTPDPLPEGAGLTATWHAKIADFGLARLVDDDITRTGLVIGTPSYMAPEQAEGRSKAVGPACDVYGLGAILYELLTGRPPFKAESTVATLELVKHAEPTPPRKVRREIPRDLETICLKCLEKAPGWRYPDAAALADDLGRFLVRKPVRARPRPHWERVGNWLYRRPGVIAAAIIAALLTGMAAIATAHWRIDVKPRPPAAVLDEAYRKLKSGKPAELLGATGLPPWYNWQAGEMALERRTPEGESLKVFNMAVSLLELLPEVPCDAYRIRFEVWLRGNRPGLGQSGIYFSHQRLERPPSPDHVFAAICMERGVRKRQAGVETFHYREPTAKSEVAFGRSAGRRIELPEDVGKVEWHQLSVEVRPDSVLGFYGAAPITDRRPPLTGTDFAQRFASLLADAHGQKAHELRLRPRGGLGIFVQNDAANFRNIVVEPLPSRSE